MQGKPRDASEDACKSTLNQDIDDQQAVLLYVLELHPTHLPIPSLVRELTHDPGDFAEGDRVERAVRDLTGAGLLHCPGGLVMPTREALHFNQLVALV